MRAVTEGILHGRRNWLIHYLCDTFPRVLNLDYIIATVPDIRAAAASNAHIFQSVAVLLQRSFDSDGNRNTSCIALDVAVQLMLRNSVLEMLHAGANINQQLDKGESLLHILAGLLHLDVIPMAEILFSHGISVHLINSAGNTCLHTAFQHGWNVWTERFADLLIRHGASINAPNAAGQTCLQAAIEHYFIKTTFSLVSMSQDLPTVHRSSVPLPPFATASSSPSVVAQHSAALASLTSWFERNGGDMSIGCGDESTTAPNLQEMDYIFSHQEDVMHTLDLFAEWDFES